MAEDTSTSTVDTSAADTTTTTAADAAVAASADATAAAARDAASRFVAKPTADTAAAQVATDAPVVPTDYSSVNLPKDATIDSAVLERTVAIARERGLSIEQAQATVDLVNEQVSASRTALLASYQPGGAEWTKQLDTWKAETLADVTLGKTPEERAAAIALGGGVLKQFKIANPEMGEAIETFLTTYGLGERRELVHLMAWLGKTAGERPLSRGNDSSVVTQEDKLRQMYPSMTT